MLDKLKKEVYEANIALKKQGLIKYTWGNVSGACHKKKLFVIKPSGVDYEVLTAKDMVVCDFDGNVIEGELNPSSDTKTHAILYTKHPDIGGIAHSHSLYATSWAQSGKDIQALGTTHADTFFGNIPCARYLSEEEVTEDYELNTGKLIVETFVERNLNIMDIPGVLLKGHAPFTWGKDAKEAVKNSVVLEEVSKMNYYAMQLNPEVESLPKRILNKHYERKHGKNSYYGQK